VARTAAILLAAAAVLAGCAQRSAPYRFRGPVVSGVSAGELPTRDRGDDGAADRDGAAGDDFRDLEPLVATAPVRRRSPLAPRRSEPSPATSSASESPLADALRSMVGLREREATPVGFALSALATIGAALDERVRDLPDAAALVAYAESRGALEHDRGHEPLLGDLVVFDNVDRGQPASALGVVVATRDDATVEFIYLRRGVVRRGYLNLAEPARKRADDGKAMNTILRQKDGRGKKGRGDMAGQLFAGFIRLDGLSAR
jgi:hypothetical protein